MIKFFYRPLYPVYFGGVIVIPKKIYIKTNGFSNQYFGWGGEGMLKFWLPQKDGFCKTEILSFESTLKSEKLCN